MPQLSSKQVGGDLNINDMTTEKDKYPSSRKRKIEDQGKNDTEKNFLSTSSDEHEANKKANIDDKLEKKKKKEIVFTRIDKPSSKQRKLTTMIENVKEKDDEGNLIDVTIHELSDEQLFFETTNTDESHNTQSTKEKICTTIWLSTLSKSRK